MKFILSFLTLILVGCGSKLPLPPEVLIKTEYVVRTAPAELKQLPPYPININTTYLDGISSAEFISATEEYILTIEAKFKVLIDFYEHPVNKK